jgi:release factor glutamine methyltransferase
LTFGLAVRVEAILAEAAAMFAGAGVAEPRRRARQLVAAALEVTPAELLMRSHQALAADQVARVRAFAARVARGEPLSRVVGQREFWGLDLALSAQTLDPRPDSETVVAAALDRLRDRLARRRLLDLGTGTGCLLLALLSELPAAFGVGVDSREGAVVTARSNARSLGLALRACFLVGDWGGAVGGQFDAVVANPPYIATSALAGLPPEVVNFDPRSALDGGEDGLSCYRRIAQQLAALLAPGGIFVGEVGAGQAAHAASILRAHGLRIEAIERDLTGIERCIVARRTADAAEAGQKNLGMCRRPV